MINRLTLTFNSNAATPIPDAAPEPAWPIKCSEPMLDANIDAPIWMMMKREEENRKGKREREKMRNGRSNID